MRSTMASGTQHHDYASETNDEQSREPSHESSYSPGSGINPYINSSHETILSHEASGHGVVGRHAPEEASIYFECEEDITQSLLSTKYRGEELKSARFATLKNFSPWFPSVDPQNEQAKSFRTWRSRRDILLKTICIIAGIVLAINFLATVIMRAKWGIEQDINTLSTGSCSKMSNINTGVHVVINILSTLLLGASNLCMQLLVAPTRSEIDKAHARFKWLNIGVPSIKNLRYIDRHRVRICLLLAFSSLPLHFLYVSSP